MPQEDSEKKCIKCSVLISDINKVKRRRICRKCARLECKEYKQKNKTHISEYNQKYKKEHQNEICQYNHEYNILNRQQIQKRHTAYLKEKRKTDVNYKISVTCRNKIKKMVKSDYSTSDLIGCSKDFLVEWLRSNFTEEMTMDNHGEYWHIDHVIPCKHFSMTDQDAIKKCFNWANLQPLKANANLSKQGKIRIDEINTHWQKVAKFAENKKIEAYFKISDYESYITTSLV